MELPRVKEEEHKLLSRLKCVFWLSQIASNYYLPPNIP
jgi:hypothetical protein